MRTLQQMPGAPEAYVLQLISGAVNAFIQGTAWSAGSGNLHISACRPGAQAAAEKMAVMAPSALLGVRHFTGAGVLCRDEVFSPAQLLDDLELRDHAARLAAGWVTDCDPARALADVLEAQAHAGFAGLPDTAARYRECYWTPRSFFRGALSHWQAAGAPRADDVHRERLAALRRAPPFVAPADRCRELDRILARAQQALGTAYTPPRGLGEPA
jgi:trimethylamine:corrinoid methyltransferase-like protein